MRENMLIRKDQWSILWVNVFLILYFSTLSWAGQNYEFVFYCGVVLVAFLMFLFTNKRVGYSNTVLWGLTFWAFLHMAGGNFSYNGVRWYNQILVPLSESYPILRYDQIVHMVGFGVLVFLVYELIKPLMKPTVSRWWMFSFILVMASCGVGALNEIVEFFATIILPETGVGDYMNNSLDLVANLIGAVVAVLFLRWRLVQGKLTPEKPPLRSFRHEQ